MLLYSTLPMLWGQITGEVPQHVVFIPETLSPYFTEPAVEIRHTGRKQEQTNEKPFFFSRSFTQPRRYDGDEQIKADQRIHEPQVFGQ